VICDVDCSTREMRIVDLSLTIRIFGFVKVLHVNVSCTLFLVIDHFET